MPERSAKRKANAPAKLRDGDRLGNYVIRRPIGKGGEANVYLATDVLLKRRAAIKVLHSGTAKRAVKEARLVATLDHPNIVRVYHFESAANVWYMAMEYVNGGSLYGRVRRVGPLSPTDAVEFTATIADALAYAHSRGVIHRDIKPRNLLINRHGIVKLADFGLARVETQASQTGKDLGVAGTPHYLAPEVWKGEPSTPRSDVYSLGGCLYFLLLGKPLFPGTTIDEQRNAHVHQQPDLPAWLPRSLSQTLVKSLAKNPDERPASASAMRDELKRIAGESQLTAWSGQSPVREAPTTIFSAESRERGVRAMLNVPPLDEKSSRVARALAGSHAAITVSGFDPGLCAQIARAALDTHSEQVIPLLRIGLSDDGDDLLDAMLLRANITQVGRPGSYAQLVDSLFGNVPDRRIGVAALHLGRRCRAWEAHDIVQLTSRAAKERGTLLITCDQPTAREIFTEFEAAGQPGLLATVEVPETGPQTIMRAAKAWTEAAAPGRVRWTEDALRLTAECAADIGDLTRIAQNAVVIATAAEMFLITTWCVLAAKNHAETLERETDIKEEWRKQPSSWPSEEVLAMLQKLRP